MRILIINDTSPDDLGGSGRVIQETASGLLSRGEDVTLLTTGMPEGRLSSGMSVRSLSVLPRRWAHYRCVFSRSRARAVASAIAATAPDIIHAHSLAWQIGYRWIPRVARDVPVFYTAHGMMPVSYGKVTGTERSLWLSDLRRARWTFNPLRNVLIRRFLRHARILTVSDALRDYYARRGFDGAGMRTLRNGIDTAFWSPSVDRAEARRRLGLPQDAAVFLLAGRLGYDKGLNLMLSLLPRLRGNPVIVLAGYVPRVPGIDHPGVRILPRQSPEGMRVLYAAADVNLVPSLCFDCFPTTSLESMACGTPVLITTRGGGREAVTEGVTGWIIDPANPGAWLERLQWCIDHRNTLPAVGAAAREVVLEHFSSSAHLDMLLSLYGEALSRRVPSWESRLPFTGK